MKLSLAKREAVRIWSEYTPRTRAAIQRFPSQITSLNCTIHAPPSGSVSPLASFENPYPPGIAPLHVPDTVNYDDMTPPTNAAMASSQASQERPTHNANRPFARKKSLTEHIKEKDKVYPRIIESHIEAGSCVGKKEG